MFAVTVKSIFSRPAQGPGKAKIHGALPAGAGAAMAKKIHLSLTKNQGSRQAVACSQVLKTLCSRERSHAASGVQDHPPNVDARAKPH
jgi:hypothetical protein